MSLSDRVPEYLLGKYQLMATVIVTVCFSLVFLFLSIPFSDSAWLTVGANQSFAYTVAFFLFCIGFISASKRLMYRMRTSLDFTYARYIAWDSAEVIVICLIYTFFTTEGVSYGLIEYPKTSVPVIFGTSFVYVLVSLGVPYVVSAMHFALNDKNNTIRLLNLESVVGDFSDSAEKDKRITLFDNNGVLKFSIKQENLYYIESDDNYIQVWYMDRSGELKQYMLRCRLKTIEDSFVDSDLLRCHRKYIVNMSKVRVLKAEKDAYYIDLDLDSLDPIPVSKTYEEAILSRFNSR